MEVAFFDTSALVKHYHIERGTREVDELMSKHIVAISELAIVEVTSALNRKYLGGEIIHSKLEWVLERFYADLENYVVVRINSGIISLASSLVLKHGLKTLDALQLASALSIKGDLGIFVTSDSKLKEAAERENLNVVLI